MTDAKRPTAIVVGCGIGGIATAARLGKAGFDVTIYEKNAYSGGRCSIVERDGFRFDQGPSLLLLPDLFKQTYEDLGEKIEDWVDLIKCDPNYRVHFHDGETIELSTDMSRMKQEIERFEGKDGFERYLGFLSEAHRHYELSVLHVLSRNFPSIFSLLRWSFIKEVLRLHPFESIWSRTSCYFQTDRLRRVFSFATMYMGMSPFEAPGTYSLLQYTELTEGIWYPRGGFWQVPSTLLKIAQQQSSVQVHFSSPIDQILIDPSNKTAQGVRLASGKEHKADVVVINADLVYAMNQLMSESEKGVRRVKALDTIAGGLKGSCSSLSFYWSMKKKFDGLGGHNVFLAEDFKGSFDSIFQDLDLPNEPSFYVNVPSRIDPSAAPEGKDAMVVLVPVGHINRADPQHWPTLVSRARAHVITALAHKLGIPDFEDLIESEKVHDAESWEREFNLTDGSILGLAHNFTQVLGFRPSTKHPRIDRLFFVGASTHPGTGVPICLAGAKLTSNQIIESFGLPISPPLPTALSSLSVPYGKPRSAKDSVLDQRRSLKTWDLQMFVWVLMALVAVLVERVFAASRRV